MKYVFLDNFRGFTRTLLQVRDVNFFVGENSTGKTSILALIKLLGTPHFWFEQRFYTDEVKLGMFKDIVSVNSPDKSYFRIGFADITGKESGESDNTDVSYAFLCTFEEEEGMPIINHYTLVTMGKQYRVHFGNKSIKYKSEGECKLVNEYEYMNTLFSNWATSHQVIGKDYTSMKIPLARKQALLYVPSFLEDIVKKERGGVTSRRKLPPYLIRTAFEDVVWLAPIRTKPLRTYDTYRLDYSPEGEHTPYLIKKLLSRRTKDQREQADRFVSFIEDFGRDSGLFKSISIKDYDRRIKTSPFELDIILTEEALSVDNVGYGVSQALPIIVELFAQEKNTWFTIQQPEIHLHPKAQTALGDILYILNQLENKRFVVETHSDFTIDGYRLRYKGKEDKRKPDTHIVFFERKTNNNVLYSIDILETGEISPNQPPAYRDFFIKEEMKLLGL
ncbi:AAA family ATPase [Chloroflexota bacterium]